MSIYKNHSKMTIRLPECLIGIEGIFAAPVNSIGIDSHCNETLLCIQDNQQNILDLSKIQEMHLQVKSGVINTDYGAIMFILFTFYEESKSNDKFTYEVILNPCDMSSIHQYGKLASQDRWKVLVILNNIILNVYEFDNVYGLDTSLCQAIEASLMNRCTDFDNAKEQYFEEYDIDTLLDL